MAAIARQDECCVRQQQPQQQRDGRYGTGARRRLAAAAAPAPRSARYTRSRPTVFPIDYCPHDARLVSAMHFGTETHQTPREQSTCKVIGSVAIRQKDTAGVTLACIPLGANVPRHIVVKSSGVSRLKGRLVAGRNAFRDLSIVIIWVCSHWTMPVISFDS